MVSLGWGKITHMQYHEISRQIVLRMVPTGTPAYFYESPHRATITFMGLKGKTAEGRREIKHMKKLRKKGGIYLPNRIKGKEMRLYNSTFKHSLR